MYLHHTNGILEKAVFFARIPYNTLPIVEIFLALTKAGINMVNMILSFLIVNISSMSHQSKIAELGVLNILNQMKNPLTNIRLCAEMMESEDKECIKYSEIIKNSAIKLEDSIRDICNSFAVLKLSIHMQTNEDLLHQPKIKE